jgi:hypothetical protein
MFTADDGVGGVDRYVRIRAMEATELLDLDETRDLGRGLAVRRTPVASQAR